MFIVGLSRSGTSLTRKILNRHAEIAISVENHYLGHLLPSEGVRHKLKRFGSLHEDANVRRIVRFIYNGGLGRASRWRTPSRLWGWVTKQVPEQELVDRLLSSERTERGFFRAVMDAYAESKGKPVGGEKTPAHLRYVPTLLAWYPSGRVVHLMRDPRAIFVSELRRRAAFPGGLPYRILQPVPGLLATLVLLQTSLLWWEGDLRSRRYARSYPDRYLLLRFEDLVSQPEKEVRKLCRFLGILFEPRMLDQVVVSRGARLGEPGIDAGAADRWRLYIHPWADRWFRILFNGSLVALDYE